MESNGDGSSRNRRASNPEESNGHLDRHRAYFAHAPLAIMVVDAAGRYVEVNPAACRLSGYDETELLAMSFSQLLAEESLEAGRQHFDRVCKVGRASGELCWIHKDGSKRWSTCDAVKLSEDRFVGFFLEVTDRRRAEEALRRGQAELRGILDAVRESVFLIDPEGIVLDCNETAAQRLGRTVGDLRGKSIHLVLPAGIAASRKAYVDEVVRSRSPVQFEDQRGGIWFEHSVYPVFDETGAVAKCAIFGRDIRERQIAVEFLRLVNASTGVRDLIRKATAFFQAQSDCEAIGIRLREGQDYPYYETRGFPPEFVRLENSLCARRENGEPQQDGDGNPVLDCMCGNIICARFDPAKPFFSRGGSFWTNCTTDLLASTTEADRQARTRNRCNGEGYESVALIPLASGDNRLGLLQLNDHRKGRFTAETIALWERLAGYLAVALAKTQAEERLRESEELYRVIASSTPDHLLVQDRDLRYTLVLNPQLGLTEQGMFGRTDADVLAQDDAAKLTEIKRRVLSTGKPAHVETSLISRKGLLEFFEGDYVPKHDSTGRVDGLIGYFRNVTDRKRADAALRKSEDRYRSLFDQMTEGFALHEIICDDRGEPCDYRFLDVNPAFEQLTGLQRSNVVGKTMREVLPGESGDWITTYGAVALTGQSVQFDSYSAGLDRHYRVLSYRPAPRQFAVIFTDVSERRRAEEQLRMQSLVLNQIQDRVTVTDLEGVITYVNDAECATLKRSRESLIGHSVTTYGDDPGRGATQHDIIRTTLAEGEWRGEVANHASDGAERMMDCRTSVVRDSNGRPVALCGIATDITERKAREREIERLNRLYAALSELNQVIVRIESREQLFREVCRITTERAGFKVAWVGRSEPESHRVVPIARGGESEDYLDEVQVYADDRPEGRGPTGTCLREDKLCVVNDFADDPRMAPWRAAAAARGLRSVAALPIRLHGEVWGALTVYDSEPDVFQDKEIALLEEAAAAISFALDNLERELRRRQAEERLLASEAGLREAQEVAFLGSYVLDIPQGRWSSSQVLDRIFDIPSDYAKTVEGWGDLVHPDERQAMLDYLRNEVSGKHQPFDREYRIVRCRDKEVRWVHGLGRLEFDAGGRLTAMVGTIQDITERKRAEQEKLELERCLLHAQKLESLGVLAGGIAHDFNNILAGIMGYADLALVRLPSSEPARADVEVIKNAAQRAADLTRQMLAYSGKGKFVVEAVDLSRIVDETRKMLEMSVSKKATLTFNLASGLPAIRGDASQIHQVVLNLVLNASDALGENRGVVGITTEAASLCEADCAAVSVGNELQEGPYVCLEVADTGCGMNQESLERIFDPFYTTKFTGRGLGLAAVHGIVRGHKGGIRVVSEPGKGTTFRVFFPAGGALGPASPVQSATTAWQGGGTVLVVDDEEIVRTTARRMMQRAGFSVLMAGDGEEAIRLYRQHQREIDCVLLDLTMPNLNGEETFRELRAIRDDVRVILSSGFSEEGATERFSGLAGFIQKPYELDTMIAALRKVIAAGAGKGPDAILSDKDDSSAVHSPAVAAHPADRSAGKKPKCEGRTVLVADDDEMALISTGLLFEQAGFDVLTARDGEEAIRRYREHQGRIACVFLDLTMPKMNGEEVLRELRRMEATVHAVVSSGYSREAVAERFAGLDVLEFVQKPEPLDDVIDKLREVCRGQ